MMSWPAWVATMGLRSSPVLMLLWCSLKSVWFLQHKPDSWNRGACYYKGKCLWAGFSTVLLWLMSGVRMSVQGLSALAQTHLPHKAFTTTNGQPNQYSWRLQSTLCQMFIWPVALKYHHLFGLCVIKHLQGHVSLRHMKAVHRSIYRSIQRWQIYNRISLLYSVCSFECKPNVSMMMMSSLHTATNS